MATATIVSIPIFPSTWRQFQILEPVSHIVLFLGAEEAVLVQPQRKSSSFVFSAEVLSCKRNLKCKTVFSKTYNNVDKLQNCTKCI